MKRNLRPRSSPSEKAGGNDRAMPSFSRIPSYGSRRFAVCDCWTQTPWQVMQGDKFTDSGMSPRFRLFEKKHDKKLALLRQRSEISWLLPRI